MSFFAIGGRQLLLVFYAGIDVNVILFYQCFYMLMCAHNSYSSGLCENGDGLDRISVVIHDNTNNELTVNTYKLLQTVC